MVRNRKQTTNSKTLYSETVAFPRHVVFISIAIETLVYIFIVASRFIEGLKQIYIPITFIGVSLIYLIFLLFTLFLLFVKARTTIEPEGIRYKMVPLERKGHLIPSKEIDKYFIKTKKKKGDTRGKQNTLYLRLRSGKKVILQTGNPKQMIRAVHTLLEPDQE